VEENHMKKSIDTVISNQLLDVELIDGGPDARMLHSFFVNTFIGLVMIPEGFVTDFASVPQFLWGIFPPWGKYSEAAVVHDFLYTGFFKCTRKQADQVFLQLMERMEVPLWKRQTMYAAVRMFGGKAFGHPRKENLAYKECVV
jgi:hypothetical protein